MGDLELSSMKFIRLFGIDLLCHLLMLFFHLKLYIMIVDKGYLLIYSFTDFMNGVIVNTAGPLIPFLTARTHIP